ncbi:uncharacterized protein K444DRAFT_614646 [Hyaloscypha bicolor E]|uniref:HAMP domain-containing protein n=1 Tax=Hyaloscypha bicolor E TaxID=1095630 RepID=A0A2J6T4J8_9HELO|nr:uncharacterized protein K444DRAFT_614646 [Hyaloscypha bicolor E]PMD57951.1 hypothetical protein K444DRAFT_614646 [Hyaloscypha bicolor E]
MDPLTAVGLAGNIITFIDLSTKVVCRTKQLYESASGATSENDELEGLTKNLKDLADRTRRKPPNTSRKGHFSLNITSETVLDSLSQQCIQVADELLETLESVKVKGDGRTVHSALQAIKTVWKQDNIDAIQRRLDRISKQLMDGMSMEQLEEINRRLREMAVENTRLEANRSKEINQLREDFNSAIEKLNSNVEEQTPGAWLVLSDTASRGRAYFAEQVILQSLRFSSIESRHESISKEHSNTFSWIFDQASPTKFVEWLKGEDGVYWVSGKPGSGKSTLIKFVAEHEQTKRCLEEWAGDKKLAIANFYFWNASTHQSQKSQRGLLRTILYQILRQCPELIQMAYHDQWIALTSDGKVLKESRDELLTVPALLNTLRNISTSTASDTKFCFFLDGLDEYDGRPADIVELVDILKSFQNVKTCVSSRPWNEFEDRFGNDSRWKLYVHDFTRYDIHLYVQETLGENSRFQQLQNEDPKCPNFVWNIVDEADGVFLWVFLVTRSLLDGLTNSDRIRDLQDRLNEIPKDLRDYFKLILFSTENRYRTQTARIFTIAVNAVRELPLMAYWVIDQGTPKYIFQCSVETPATEILDSRLDNMRRRLKVLSKGLLDAEDEEPKSVEDYLIGFKVTFLHRTVKDYLKTPDAQSMLQSWLDDTFSADWEVCNAFGALAKMTPPAKFTPTSPIALYMLICMFFHAPCVDQNPLFRADIASLLEHLQTALAPALRENKESLSYELTRRKDSCFLKGDSLDQDIAIISLCVCCGVFNYVSEKFAKEPKLCHKVTNHVPALVVSLRRINGLWAGSLFSLEQESLGMLMLELLLAQGVDPNVEFKGMTEWRRILEDLMDERYLKDDSRPKSFEGLKLLLQHGADFQQQCTVTEENGDVRKATANELLREWYDADQFGMLEDIVKRRDTKKKMKHGISKKIGHLKLWVTSKK